MEAHRRQMVRGSRTTLVQRSETTLVRRSETTLVRRSETTLVRRSETTLVESAMRFFIALVMLANALHAVHHSGGFVEQRGSLQILKTVTQHGPAGSQCCKISASAEN